MARYLNQLIQQKRDVGWDPEAAVADVFESCQDPRLFFDLMKEATVDQPSENPQFHVDKPVVHVPLQSNVRKPRVVVSCFKEPPATVSLFKCEHCGYVGHDWADDGAYLICPQCSVCKDNRVNFQVYMSCGFSDFLSNASYYNGQERRVRYSRNNYFLENLQKVLGNEFLCRDIQRHPKFDKLLNNDTARKVAKEGGVVALINYMRSLRLGRVFYQHAHSIYILLLGVHTKKPRLDEYTVLNLEKLFNKAVEAYDSIRGNRKNFLNYAYVLRRLLLIVDREDLVDCIPVLKTRSRLHEHNKLWMEICKINKWPMSIDSPS